MTEAGVAVSTVGAFVAWSARLGKPFKLWLMLRAPLRTLCHLVRGVHFWLSLDPRVPGSLRRVLLALSPLDTATANYGMARSLRQTGDNVQARRYLLESLDTAPNFRPAQKLLLEIKSVERLAPVHHAQVRSYLRASGMRVGLLINFNVPLLSDGIRRIVC